MSFEKIQIENSKLPHARFDMSKDHITSFQWGEVSPIFCKTFDTPDQKFSFTSQKLARLNPLISPTYGRIKIKEYYQFVPWKSIFRGCNSFLAQVARKPNYDKLLSRVDRLPRIETCVFMYLLTRAGYSHSWIYGRQGSDVLANDWSPLSGGFLNAWRAIFPTLASTQVNLDPTVNSSCENQNGITWANSDWKFSPDTSDYMCCAYMSGPQYDVKLCMKLTQKGLRLQKLILGCGLPLSFQSDMKCSILHLLSVYRAYFDVFQIKQYWNWEDTAANELVKFYDTNVSSVWDITLQSLESNSDLLAIFTRFIDELVDMYYTANVNNISSQLPLDWSLNAPELNELSGLLELDGIYSADQGSPVPGTKPDLQQQFISTSSIAGNSLNPAGVLPSSSGQEFFSQFTDEFIKKAYYYCNKKTQLGYDIANLLKAKGLGGYVELLDSGFVGKCETSLTISEVISTADTNLRQLGDYAGQSSKWDGSDKMYLHNNEIGVLVGLAVVVPESHLSNCPDMSQFYTTPQEFYNPLLDGLGYEGLPRMAIGHDEAQFHQRSGTHLNGTFGLQPRYQSSKVMNDSRSGMFALRSVRDTYNPFHLAQLVTCHESEVVLNGTQNATTGAFKDYTEVQETTTVETFPNAGEVWRFPAKYEFMGHYNRIFYDDPGVNRNWFKNEMDNRYPSDGFMAFFHFDANCSAPKLPVSKTFETICEETEDNQTWTASK